VVCRLISISEFGHMAAAAELILRSPAGAEPAVFRWPPAVPVSCVWFRVGGFA